jgi:hypothetical protein
MKTKTRKYKTKNRKTRRGGAPIKEPAPIATAPVTTTVQVSTSAPDVKKTDTQTSFWGSIFGQASKPGDKIIKAIDELITLLKEKNISTELKLEQIKSEAAKLT